MKLLPGLFIFLSLQAQSFEVETKVYNTMKDFVEQTDKQNLKTTNIQTTKNVTRTVSANPPELDEPILVYHSPDANMVQKTRVIRSSVWTGPAKESMRLDLLLKLYYANIKDLSKSGQRHLGCFFGDAESVASEFFQKSNPIMNVQNMFITVSEDRKMLGLEFNYKRFGSQKLESGHFRMPHCIHGGKTALIDIKILKQASSGADETLRDIASVHDIRWPAQEDAVKAKPVENGFDVYDKLSASDENSEISKKLPRFKLRADFDQMRPQPENRPWKGMDISTEAGAIKFGQVVLDYFYDSMIIDKVNLERNFDAASTAANKPKWCHMPWLNVGDAGRELIHGLTKERDLEKSIIYPEVATVKEKEGSDWGIGFYNDIACATANQVFGTHPGKTLNVPDFTKSNFPEGSVSVKVLFTTAKLDALNDSYTWTANVSLPKSTSRRLREVKMVQIDIAVKDSTLKGVRNEVDGWLMTTYYFDPTYTATSRHKFAGALAGLLKMRPIGVQTGFDPSTSMIFKDSKTNSSGNEHYGADPRLLNGPADNPKASCLSCHGAAGTTVKMVPGIKDFAEYSQIKHTGLDFSQQLALAKRNYETRSGQIQKKKSWK